MVEPQITFLAELLDSIPHAPERPHPQGIQAIQRWTRLIVNLILHPTQWSKLGFAVQWAKWIEWEGGLDLKSPVRSPGILYLQNPLHPFALNNLLNQLDFSLVDTETLVGCVDTGDWACLLKEEEQPDPKMREQVTQSLEHLCLLSFYLRNGLASLSRQSSLNVATDPKEQSDDRLIQDLVSRIMNDQTTTTTTTPRNPIWRQAFSEQALRLTAQQDPNNALLPSKLSVILNELLEVIRLSKIRQDGWTDPAVSDKLSDAEFQQLGKLLSTSFFTIIEFANVSLFLSVENIAFLSKFAAQLPASWHSDDFLRTTIQMAKRYLSTEQLEKVRIPFQVQGLVAITTLWSYWMRKTGSGDVNILGQELIEIMAEILATPSLFIGSESKGLFSACFSGLATGLDKWSGLMEPKIIQGMVSALEHGRVSAHDTDLDGIQASLATVLRSNVLDKSPESIKKLVKTFLEVFYSSSEELVLPAAATNVDELLQVQRLFQFVVTYKAGLLPVKDGEDTKKKKKKGKPKKVINLKGLSWFEALIHGVQDISTKGALSSLLAVAGILRAIQHAEDDPPKVDAESLALVQDLFVAKLNGFTETSKTEGSVAMLSSRTQTCIAFITSQTIPNLPSCKLEALDCSLLANLLVEYILQPNEGVVPVSEILRVISYETSQERNRLLLTGPAHQLLNKTVKGPIFPEMGRVARAVATLIEKMENLREIEDLLQRMHSFAINIHVDWSRCGLSKADSFLERKDGESGLDSDTTKTMGMLFQVFKTILFAYTMIFGSISEKVSSTTVSVGLISNLDYLMLDSYAYLFFITYKLSPGGFQVYEELVTSILTRMVTSEELTAAQQQQILRQNGRDDNINRHILLNNTVKSMMPRAELGFYDPVMESRTLFFMNLLERLMAAIDEGFLEQHLLPLVYPYLLKNDQRDLFESSHSAVMAVFLTNKKIAKKVAPFYSNLLLQHFPDQINIDQLRAAFTTMIRSLSETEDALAWLCVEKLLERIQYYDDLAEAETNEGEKATASKSLAALERQKQRGELLLALFDQLSSLNLVFVETLGEKIRELVAKEQSLVGRKALLKCILDVVGGSAVDHTKRDWAVKWYLGLVNEFGHSLPSPPSPTPVSTSNSTTTASA
ncbi:hypothetical protein BGX21_008059 [Mortierella sp. AD011]|nr:hypothetical protein BGX20_011332 [Mortierella sp. AD010]KAF9398215.1 hypothetical protein BGX21_008059 [Mortierella sp. AD011]